MKASGEPRQARPTVQVLTPPAGPAFPILESKLTLPPLRPGIVPRPALVDRLRADRTARLATVVAPAGYGKTTLLVQWAKADHRRFAWVSLDERDNDPSVLLTYITVALGRLIEMDPAIHAALASSRASSWVPAVHRIVASVWLTNRPIVLVLDDVHALHGRDALDALAELTTHIPPRSLLAVVGRSEPDLPLARLRADRDLVELTAADLALGADEAGQLFRGAGVDLPGEVVATLTDRTEGWPAGLYLAALSVKSGRSAQNSPQPSVEGDDRLIAGYLQSELLSFLSEDDIRFATRTAVLERMSGPLCDALLERTGSAEILQSLERSNLFIVPLDNRGAWYRYHHLFQDMLRTRLAQREPELIAELNRRAAAWHEANGSPEEAIPYAQAAGDTDRVARLVGALVLPAYYGGRGATARRWIGWFDDRSIEPYPAVAVLGAWIHALAGEPELAMRWADAAERSTVDGRMPDGSASKAGWIAMMRAVIARGSVEQMQADAVASMEGISQTGAWWPVALLVRAYSHLLVGETDRADKVFADALAASNAVGAFTTSQLSAAERSLISMEAGDVAAAAALASEARGSVLRWRLGEYSTTAVVCAASARVAIWQGDVALARRYLAHAQGLRPMLTYACRGFPYTHELSSPGRGCSLATPRGSAASSSRSTASGGAGRTSGSWSTRRRLCGGRSGRCRPTRQVHLRSPPPNCGSSHCCRPTSRSGRSASGSSCRPTRSRHRLSPSTASWGRRLEARPSVAHPRSASLTQPRPCGTSPSSRLAFRRINSCRTRVAAEATSSRRCRSQSIALPAAKRSISFAGTGSRSDPQAATATTMTAATSAITVSSRPCTQQTSCSTLTYAGLEPTMSARRNIIIRMATRRSSGPRSGRIRVWRLSTWRAPCHRRNCTRCSLAALADRRSPLPGGVAA